MRSGVNIKTKRLSNDSYNLKEVVKGIKNSNVLLATEYRLNLVETSGDTYLLIDSGTYCGLEIHNASSNPSLKVIIGGIYMDVYYNDRGHDFLTGYSYDSSTDLNDVYLELVQLELLNKDSFEDMFVCLLDYKLQKEGGY